ncbi:MAG: ABC transporter permease [Clostridia bacterium]|nr:ABC transporter permease [Clostridia bacterium]
MLKRFYRDLKRYWPYALRSAKATLQAEVNGSYLNWLWWILNPLSFMLIYTFIYGVVFNASEPYFPLFIFIGITLWDFFNRTISNCVLIVKSNKQIVTRAYLPKCMLVISNMLVNGFKMLISMGICAVMLLFYRVPPQWTMPLAVLPFAGAILFTFGAALIVMHLGVYIQDMANIVQIVLRLMMYLTGIFYDVGKRVPAPYNTLILWVNPMSAYVSQVRNALLYGNISNTRIIFVWFALSAVVAYLGLKVVYKNENNYIKVI